MLELSWCISVCVRKHMITVSCQTKNSRFSSIRCWWEALHSTANRVCLCLFNRCTCALTFLLLHKVLEDLAKPGRQWHNVSEPNSPWQHPRCVKGCVFIPVLCLCACSSWPYNRVYGGTDVFTLCCFWMRQVTKHPPTEKTVRTTKAIHHYQWRNRRDHDFSFFFSRDVWE